MKTLPSCLSVDCLRFLNRLFFHTNEQTINLADSVIVGRFVGSNAFAAVGATASITYLFFALFNGIVEVIGRFTIPVLLTAYLGYGEAGIVWIISGITAWIRYLIYSRMKLPLPTEPARRFHHAALFHRNHFLLLLHFFK